MSGALAKLGRLLLWAAKKFFTWALEKFGYSLSTIESIIDKGIAVLKAIFTGPIQFVKNLIAAAKPGFTNFAQELPDASEGRAVRVAHRLAGRLTLPETWDLKGIASVAVPDDRHHLDEHPRQAGAPDPGAGRRRRWRPTFDLVKTLVRRRADGGLGTAQGDGRGDASRLHRRRQDLIKWKIVEEAIKTVVALFIPGAGIVRAIIGIYDTIVFFIQKAKQIMEMIGNFLGSIAEIAAGNIGAAADALESGLARGLKLVITFLAKFLQLDGITARIRAALDAVRDQGRRRPRQGRDLGRRPGEEGRGLSRRRRRWRSDCRCPGAAVPGAAAPTTAAPGAAVPAAAVAPAAVAPGAIDDVAIGGQEPHTLSVKEIGGAKVVVIHSARAAAARFPRRRRTEPQDHDARKTAHLEPARARIKEVETNSRRSSPKSPAAEKKARDAATPPRWRSRPRSRRCSTA